MTINRASLPGKFKRARAYPDIEQDARTPTVAITAMFSVFNV
jgi:hypothetical protein